MKYIRIFIFAIFAHFFSTVIFGMDNMPTPLHLAAAQGDLATVKTILEHDKSMVNSTNAKFNNTPLHLAAWFNHPHIIPVLVNAGAEVNKTNKLGSTPIHSASWRNSNKSLKILLKCNASAIQANTTGVGNSPLYLAAKAGALDCEQTLLNYLREYLTQDEFVTHLNQKCSGDCSTAVQAAGTRWHMQCYWNLIIAGANYREKSYNRYTKEDELTSDTINNNKPIKSFIEVIEKNGKENPPRYNYNETSCYQCNMDYKHNDVVMTLTLCNHSFHASCFEDIVLEHYINQNNNSTLIKDLLKKGSLYDAKHELRTNPLVHISWTWVKGCPECTQPTLVDEYGKLSVFLDEKEAK